MALSPRGFRWVAPPQDGASPIINCLHVGWVSLLDLNAISFSIDMTSAAQVRQQ
jgi:hypothetical protein